MDVRGNTLGKTSLGEPVVVDWLRCCICQCNSGEKLICPARNPVEKTRNSGYENFSKSVKTLIPFSYVLPSRMPINIFGDGESILDVLIKNEAKWHKSCIRQYLEPRLTALIKNALMKKPRKLLKAAAIKIRVPRLHLRFRKISYVFYTKSLNQKNKHYIGVKLSRFMKEY